MPIHVTDAVTQTWWVILALGAAILVTLRQKQTLSLTKETTQELKGIAILAVLFAHIGYALVDDTRFLFPLSISAGVAVNLFLFLSGYGLAQTSAREPLSVSAFYRKRLQGLYLPLWIVLIGILVLDAVRIGRTYLPQDIIQAFFGFFPRADLYQNINSPLWYFTFIIGHYLLFPLIYRRTRPILSAIVFGVISLALLSFPWTALANVQPLYKLHLLAFPLGLLAAGLTQRFGTRLETLRASWQHWGEMAPRKAFLLQLGASLAFLAPFAFLSLNAAIGQGIWREQGVSLVTMGIILLFFLVKPFESRFLQIMGRYSYEIYLVHWPLLSRHDGLYGRLPAGAATIGWVGILAGLGYGLQRFVKRLNSVRGWQPMRRDQQKAI